MSRPALRGFEKDFLWVSQLEGNVIRSTHSIKKLIGKEISAVRMEQVCFRKSASNNLSDAAAEQKFLNLIHISLDPDRRVGQLNCIIRVL